MGQRLDDYISLLKDLFDFTLLYLHSEIKIQHKLWLK